MSFNFANVGIRKACYSINSTGGRAVCAAIGFSLIGLTIGSSVISSTDIAGRCGLPPCSRGWKIKVLLLLRVRIDGASVGDTGEISAIGLLWC